MPDVLTLNDVAALLRMSGSTFRSRRRALEAAGFPRPLPGAGLRWSPYAIDQWLRTNGGQETPAENVDPVAAARAALEARINGRAA